MATQTKQDPVQNALLDYMLKQQQNPGAQTNQAVQTIMSNPDIAKAYNDRVNYYNSTNQDLAKTVDDQAKNGVNGMAVNVSPNFQGLASVIPQNQAMTNSFLASLVGAASGETNNTNTNAASTYGNVLNNQVQQGQLNLNKANAGYTDVNGNPYAGIGVSGGSGDSGLTTDNPVVDGAVQNILNGSKDMGSVASMPPALQNQVYAKLQQRGYDPSKQATDALNQVEKAYFGYNLSDKNKQTGNELSNVNSAGGAENALTNWLSDISGGKIQLGNTPRIKNYQNIAQTLQGNIESAVAASGGKPTARLSVLLKGGAPTENTSMQDAQNYFTAVRQALNNSFFPNGVNPHENQIRVKIGNMTGTVNASEYDPKTMQKL